MRLRRADCTWALLERGLAHRARYHHAAALRDLDRVIELGPGHPPRPPGTHTDPAGTGVGGRRARRRPGATVADYALADRAHADHHLGTLLATAPDWDTLTDPAHALASLARSPGAARLRLRARPAHVEAAAEAARARYATGT